MEDLVNIGETLINLLTVEELTTIEGADRIELARVGGWDCIVGKGTVQPGQNVTFITPDTMLSPAAALLFPGLKATNKDGWVRIKVMKMRGVYSAGLVHPSEHAFTLLNGTEHLKKYSTSSGESGTGGGKSRGTLPFGITKTDQENRQNLKFCSPSQGDVPQRYIDQDSLWIPTLKLDGMSMTIAVKRWPDYGPEAAVEGEDPFETHVCSRNLSLDVHQEGNAFIDAALATAYGCQTYPSVLRCIRERAEKQLEPGEVMVVRGELVGPGIQDNRMKFKHRHWFVFETYIVGLDGSRRAIAHPETAGLSVPSLGAVTGVSVKDTDPMAFACLLVQKLREEAGQKNIEFASPSTSPDDVEGLVFWRVKDSAPFHQRNRGVRSFKYVFPGYMARTK